MKIDLRLESKIMTVYMNDAAGRLVKEGDKVYSYGWLDKIVNVQENGTMFASFDNQKRNDG